MKKLVLFFAGLFAFTALQAQWVDDPATNTFIANCGNDDGEIYLSTCPTTGDTYVQWEGFGTNGWSPTLQRLTFEGVPQWGADGIHIGAHEFSSYSEGVAMASTADGGVVSCFATYEGYTYAVKINPDGTFAWGEEGLQLFDGHGFSRAEIAAGEEGGCWALGFDYERLYLQFIDDDGTMGPTITISSNTGMNCMFGQLTISKDNNVFVTYEQVGSGFYAEKELHVVGFTTFGAQIAPDVLLMSSQTFQSTYIHHAIADGVGGGYAYIWHPGIGQAFNVYVFHFDEVGNSTISDLNGIPVHSADPANFYLSASATVDPLSHDLILAYEQTDASTQSESRVYLNRITTTGEKVWGEGIVAANYLGDTYSDIKVDAFEDGSGFSLVYTQTGSNPYFTTIEAMGFDMDGNPLWTRSLCTNAYRRTMCDNSTGFNLGQNIVAWVNATNGGLYGQNFGTDGTMGELPITPIPPQCPGPDDFQGEYVYDMETETFGVRLTWTPILEYDYYILTRTDVSTSQEDTFEIEGTAVTVFDESGIGQFRYQLKGASEECGLSLPALTPDGEDYVIVEVTGIEENLDDEIVTIVKIFNANGQSLQVKDLNELNTGLYILQGLTKDGKIVSKKMVVNK